MKTSEYVVARREGGMELRDFLKARRGVSGKKAKALLDSRCVLVNSRRVWMAGHKLAPGDKVSVPDPPAGAARAPGHALETRIRILFRDDHYLVADKPPGLLSDGPDSFESLLRGHTGNRELRAAHRLDRETSGCLLLAMNAEAFDKAVDLFRRGLVGKAYHAIVSGEFTDEAPVSRQRLDGQRAVSRFHALAAKKSGSHLTVVIETGRTHQVRRHLAAMGHPVVGDKIYTGGRALGEEERKAGRHMLHAFRLAFPHPFKPGVTVRCEAPLPGDFMACLGRLGLD